MESHLISLAQAAHLLGISAEQVRRHIHNGHLRGYKIGKAWAVHYWDVDAFAYRPPRGRPLSADAAWTAIFDGIADIESPHRYARRGRLTRWYGTVGSVTELLSDSDVVVSGVHAVDAHAPPTLSPLYYEAQVYVREDGPAVERLADRMSLDTNGGVLVRMVDRHNWARLDSVAQRGDRFKTDWRCAPALAVALDLITSRHPRERCLVDDMLDGWEPA